MPRYTEEEVEAILREALQEEPDEGDEAPGGPGLDHADLVAVAKEVGIEPRALERAALRVLEQREEAALVHEADALAQRSLRRCRLRFFRHAASYGIVISALAILDVVTGPGAFWFYAAIGWGIGLAMDAVKTWTFDLEAARERHLRRLKRRALRGGGRRGGRSGVAVAVARLESAAERGTRMLLERLADKIETYERRERARRAGLPQRKR